MSLAFLLGFLLAALLPGRSLAAPTPLTSSLKDDSGRSIVIATPPQRIVSASLASDEIALALTQMAQSEHRLLALSPLADDPRYSNIAPVPSAIKQRFAGDLEALVAMKPDLVLLASYNKPETLARLNQVGVRTFVLSAPASLDDVARNISTIGALLHLTKEADALRQSFTAELENLRVASRSLASRPRLMLFFEDGATAGKGTLFDDVMQLAGAVNLVSQQDLHGWPRLAAENLAQLRPDFLVAGVAAGKRPAVLDKISSMPGWREMPAVKTGQMIFIPSQQLGAASHHVTKAIAALQAQLRQTPPQQRTPAQPSASKPTAQGKQATP